MQWWCKRAAAATVTHAGLATIYFDTKIYYTDINSEIFVFCRLSIIVIYIQRNYKVPNNQIECSIKRIAVFVE